MRRSLAEQEERVAQGAESDHGGADVVVDTAGLVQS